MVRFTTISASGKKPVKLPAVGFTETTMASKYERIAHNCLRNLLIFEESLEEEMERLRAYGGRRAKDLELMEKMSTAKTRYDNVMHGLSEYNDNEERQAIIALGDALQDLMICLHKQRRKH